MNRIPEYIENIRVGDEMLIHLIDEGQDLWVEVVSFESDLIAGPFLRVKKQTPPVNTKPQRLHHRMHILLYRNEYGTMWRAYDSVHSKPVEFLPNDDILMGLCDAQRVQDYFAKCLAEEIRCENIRG